jgi:toxin ParE1/3/4
MAGARRIRLTAAAHRDFTDIISWTAQRFGANQARLYAQVINAAIAELAGDSKVAGSRARDELGIDVRILPVARRGRRGRHLLVYRSAGDDELEILRILHEAMDIPRHVSGDTDRADES